MDTIDQITEQPGDAKPALLKAKQFYDGLLEQEGPPARLALAHYRLGKIHERLGDASAACDSYKEAIIRWEKIQDGKDRPMQDARDRLQVLAAK